MAAVGVRGTVHVNHDYQSLGRCHGEESFLSVALCRVGLETLHEESHSGELSRQFMSLANH